MPGKPPTECPECGTLSVQLTKIPPWSHERGEDWVTKAECEECDQYQEWFK